MKTKELLEIKIETGVPLAPRRSKSPLRAAMEKMQPGDSFQLPINAYSEAAFYRAAFLLGIKITVRNTKTTVGVWKVS